jgi:hypothetical protein
MKKIETERKRLEKVVKKDIAVRLRCLEDEEKS